MKFKEYINEGYKESAERYKGLLDKILSNQKGKTTISNPDWQSLKRLTNNYLENAEKTMSEIYFLPIIRSRDRSTPTTDEEMFLIYNTRPELHTFEGRLKKIQSFSPKTSIYKEGWSQLEKFYKDNLELVKEVNSWKDKVYKKVPGEAKAKKTAEVHKILSTNKDVKDIVTQIAEDFRPQLENEFQSYMNRMIDRRLINNKVLFQKDDTIARGLIISYLTVEYTNRTDRNEYQLKSNYKKLIVDDSKRNANNIIEDFIHKLVIKLNTILSKKGNLSGIRKEGNNTKNNDIYIEFKDGSKFKMRNQIVYGYSMYGRPFNRYPSTFHDVILPGGSRMPNPSEAEMINNFAEAK